MKFGAGRRWDSRIVWRPDFSESSFAGLAGEEKSRLTIDPAIVAPGQADHRTEDQGDCDRTHIRPAKKGEDDQNDRSHDAGNDGEHNGEFVEPNQLLFYVHRVRT